MYHWPGELWGTFLILHFIIRWSDTFLFGFGENTDIPAGPIWTGFGADEENYLCISGQYIKYSMSR